MKIIRISKHILPNLTYQCGHCGTPLNVISVDINPKHFFNPGQHYGCSCGKSEVWSNSVRRLNVLEDYCDGEEVDGWVDPEMYGFCNDQFCPKCWGTFSVIKNGQFILDDKKIENIDLHGIEDLQGLVDDGRLKSVDVYGCRGCVENQELFHMGVEGGEYDGQKSCAEWFRDHQEMWRSK